MIQKWFDPLTFPLNKNLNPGNRNKQTNKLTNYQRHTYAKGKNKNKDYLLFNQTIIPMYSLTLKEQMSAKTAAAEGSIRSRSNELLNIISNNTYKNISIIIWNSFKTSGLKMTLEKYFYKPSSFPQVFYVW